MQREIKKYEDYGIYNLIFSVPFICAKNNTDFALSELKVIAIF